jgi:hypothetical protein
MRRGFLAWVTPVPALKGRPTVKRRDAAAKQAFVCPTKTLVSWLGLDNSRHLNTRRGLGRPKMSRLYIYGIVVVLVLVVALGFWISTTSTMYRDIKGSTRPDRMQAHLNSL